MTYCEKSLICRGYPSRAEVETLQTFIDAADVNGQVHSLLHSELGAQLPLHVSLSAPLVLKSDQKSDFEEVLEKNIKRSGVVEIESFLRGLRWERNFDGTRWFLVLRISKPLCDGFNRLLDCCNECADRFDLPLLYDKKVENPTDVIGNLSGQEMTPDLTDAFHISIAWQLTDPLLKQKMVLAHPDVMKLSQFHLHFELVKLKMGNFVKDIQLGRGANFAPALQRAVG